MAHAGASRRRRPRRIVPPPSQARLWREVADLFCSLAFLQARITLGDISGLLSDFDALLVVHEARRRLASPRASSGRGGGAAAKGHAPERFDRTSIECSNSDARARRRDPRAQAPPHAPAATTARGTPEQRQSNARAMVG